MAKKVFLITGASSGIGAETAKHLADLEHRVYGAARRIEKLKELEQFGVKPVQLDITDTKSIKPTIDKILNTEGHIDVLVNNAGYSCTGLVETVPVEEARRQFEVNLFGLGEITKAVLPSMREKRSGRIINISSVGGVIAFPGMAWYHASKFALEGWSDSLRMELYEFNIPVIVIQPGLISTEFGEVSGENFAKHKQEIADYAPLFEAYTNRSQDLKYSHPKVIAEVVEHASLSPKPKTRYAAGSLAKPILFIRRLLNDLQFTKYMLKMRGLKPKKYYNL